MKGRIYVFSGPSGAGKSTLTKKLRQDITDLAYSISHTSRLPRENERNGVDYHFVDRDTFNRMIEEKAFVEWASVYNDLYGTTFAELDSKVAEGLEVILDIDSQGAKNIKEHFKESILIYILPPSLEVLEARLRNRASDNGDVIQARISKANMEIRDSEWYDYLVINDELEEASREIESIIIADRCSRQRSFPEIKKRFGI